MRKWFSKIFPRAGFPPMPIIVGSPRSGTTLLRFMLDSHPLIAIPPETGFLILGAEFSGTDDNARENFFRAVTAYPPDAPVWMDFQIPAEEFYAQLRELRPFTAADGFRLFYKMYAKRLGKSQWGDKTPMYCRHLRAIESLLPEARFVHIIRDGRDAAVSLRSRPFSPGHDIAVQANYWRENVLIAREQGRACKHYHELRYEDLLREPEAKLRGVCAFLELEFDAAMLRYHERTPERLREHHARHRADGSVMISQEERLAQQAKTQSPLDLSRIGAGRRSLSTEENRQFETIAGDTLKSCRYPLSDED